MSTLPNRAQGISLHRPLAGFARVRSVMSAVIDVFAEAQAQARAVQDRYPFAE
jgi:hypothetical protein